MPKSKKLVFVLTALATLALSGRCLGQTTAPASPQRELVDVTEQQTEAGEQPTDAQPPASQPAPTQPCVLLPGMQGRNFIFILLGGMVLIWFLTSRSRRKQEAKRKEMLANIKKGDRVTSIGGIIGTVADVREDEVTVKVDENNNVRMKLARWAIRGVGEEAKAERPEDSK